MHILHLSPYYRPAYAFGGVVRAVEGLAGALAKRGHQVTVLTTDALDQKRRYGGAADEWIDGVRVLRRPNAAPWLRGRLNLSAPRGLKKTAAAVLPDVDVLHVHEFRTVENLLATPTAQPLNKPIVLSPHGTLALGTGRSRLKAGWDRLFSRRMARRVDHVIALTETELDDAKTFWQALGQPQMPTFSVISNGIHLHHFADLPDAADFRRRYDLGEMPTVLFMGRLQRRKGLDVLIQAFQQANVEHSRLLIAGPDEGMMNAIQALAAGDERIAVAGYLSGEERWRALAAGDVFALPAVGEGLSIAALEAMAAEMPVILSPGCNMNEVEAAGAGYVAAASADAFAAKLRLLLADSDRRARMGKAARQLIAQKYTWDTIVIQLESVYSGLLQS